MPKRPSAKPHRSPAAPKRPRKKKNATEEEEEDSELLAYQLRRRQIIESQPDEEELLELQEEGGEYLSDIYIPPKITRTEHPFTGERMVIETISCENFKSYGGLKQMGPFHKSFTAIIGPNGNGKSNIIDAMLFVFGYRASKIRCKKISTLIHSSELVRDVKECAVTVEFVKIIDNNDEQDDFQVVEGSRIQVKRRAWSDNRSSYYLNGKVVKFQDIAKFLKNNGVDLTHNRFLILQGEVEQIAQMPPIGSNGNDGLLEFLEDIIGTRRYIRPLAMLEERVEKLDYEREERLQRLDKAEKDKAALEEPVRKATDYLKNQNSKTRYQNILYQKQIYELKKKLGEKEEGKKVLEEKMKVVQERLDEILAVNQEKRDEISKAEKEFKKMDKEYQKVKKAFESADAEFIKLNQELKRTNEMRKKLQTEVSKIKAEIEKLNAIPGSHEKEIEALSKRKNELTVDINEEEGHVAGKLEKLNSEVEKALREKEVADRKYSEQKGLRDEKKASLDRLEKALSKMKDVEASEKRKLEQLEEELQSLKENVSKREREGRTSLGSNKVQQMEAKLKESSDEEKQRIELESQKRSLFEQARDEFTSAKESLEGNNQMDRVDRALLEAKADGTLPGLYGRLKNLAKIPEKYNIAATVSTGMLEYWITDNDTTAGNCINFLRENNLPVQNFLCLTRIERYGQMARQRFDVPQGGKRIFDLLEISEGVLVPAYYKAFQNTLVAENIEAATKVSYGGHTRYRVATLKGEIVEPTGSMVGGGRAVTEGKFNSRRNGITVTKQQVAGLERTFKQASQEYQQAQEHRQEKTEEVRKLSEAIADLKRKINNFASDLEALKAQIPLKEGNVAVQKNKVKETSIPANVLKNKEAEIASIQDQYEELDEPFKEAQEKANELSQKVKDLQETKRKEITKKLDKFKDQMKKVEEELNRKIIELKNCETNKNKAEKKLEKTEGEIEKLQEKMREMHERKTGLEQEAIDIKKKEEELLILVNEAREKFEELKKTSNQNEKEEKSLTKEKALIEAQLTEAKGEAKSCQQHLKSTEETLKGLNLHEIPEEELEVLKVFSDDEIKPYQISEVERKIKKYVNKIKSKPIPNLEILEEYKEKIEALSSRIKEFDEITAQRNQFRDAYCKLDQQRKLEFMEGFALISARLKEMFRMISMGGDAELEVVDELDLFGCGINFTVRPARKTWKKISNLSGGEKTLASLSLVFALHHFKPSPFYVMDEIDAALDFKNVSIIANYIKDRTKFTQFIIISLRSNMFELADTLLGVYKVDNMSYSIHVNVKKTVNELRRMVGLGAARPSNQGHQQHPGGSQQGNNNNRPNLDVSPIIDDHDDEDSSIVMEDTVVQAPPPANENNEEEADKTCTPPDQVVENPSAVVEQVNRKSSTSGVTGSSHQTEEPMDTTPAPRRQSLPKFTSTPFSVRKPQDVGGGGEEESGSNVGVEPLSSGSPAMSPIRGDENVVNEEVFATPSVAVRMDDDEEEGFHTAEDDEPEVLGPSQ